MSNVANVNSPLLEVRSLCKHFPSCVEEAPGLIEIESGRHSACHFVDEGSNS